MILLNLKPIPKSITLDDGKTILLHPSQKNYKLPKKYQDDKILKEHEKKGIVRILKDEENIKEIKVKDKKEKKGVFMKNLLNEEKGDENE